MLRKKMLRDIKHNLSQFITIFLMVFIGVLAYSGIESYMMGMQYTADKFYKENNLQDLNVIGANFTKEDLDNIKKIDHVKNAERKLSITTKTDGDKTLLTNFIESNKISKFYVVKGEKFDVDKKGIWLDAFYADANKIKIGDEITIKYDGYTFKEKVLGFINVPDHVYDVKDESELYPNHEEFGFAYLSSNELEGYIKSKAASSLGVREEDLDKMDFNYKDELVFNYVMVDVSNKKNDAKVKDEIEKKIDNAKTVIKIEDSTSYRQYQGEIDEGKTYIGVFSGLFIFIAMLSVITTMTRVVKNQRVQIGTLKALGFKNYKIFLHYMSYGFWISLVASICGIIAGYYGIGNLFINMEMSFFEIPNGTPVLMASCFICAALVVLAVVVVSFIACRKNLILSPADTLRPESPKVKATSLLLTTKGIFKKFNFSTKWNLRDMFRNKARTLTGIVGITGCCMLIVCAFGMLDSLNSFIKLQFEDLYNFSYKLSLKSDISESNLNKLKDKYGSATSQASLIEIKNKDGKKESNNVLITDASNKVRFVDNKGKFIKLDSEDGVYITYKLASNMGYKKGDIITWKIVGSDKYYKSKIVGFNKDPQNQNMTITRGYYEKLGNKYEPDSLYADKDLSNTKEIDNVLLIQDINSLEEGMSNMLSTMKSMIVLIIFIAIVLGSVIIYNMCVLSYTEKEYQFATLKVLGFRDRQIRKIFIKQNNIIAVISIILGLPAGFYLTDWLYKTAIEESYDFGANISIMTYVYAIIGTFLTSYIVSKILSKKINNIDMVTSLKGNE